MRIGAVVVAVILAGCSLDLLDDSDEPDPDPIPPAPRCELGPRYRLASTDCGPRPPDAPPMTCYWTITIDARDILYCYSDVCESLSYECEGGGVTASSSPERRFTGTL